MNNISPPNASDLDNAIASAAERISGINVDVVATLWNAETCPLALLPWLAWAEQVPDWSTTWPETTQRASITAQRLLRKKSGTRAAVEAAVAALGGSVTITEWWETNPPGEPGAFAITLNAESGYVTGSYQQAMTNAIERTKRLTAHYTMGVGQSFTAAIGMVGVLRTANFLRLKCTEV